MIIHYLAGLIYPTYQCDLFICSAKKEYEYVKNTYGHPDGVVQYTGLCRFDYLHRFTIKKQILLMRSEEHTSELQSPYVRMQNHSNRLSKSFSCLHGGFT